MWYEPAVAHKSKAPFKPHKELMHRLAGWLLLLLLQLSFCVCWPKKPNDVDGNVLFIYFVVFAI